MISPKENVSLSAYTTIRTGGPARWFVTCKTETEVLEALAFAANNQLKILVLGAGSNLLVSDLGFPGLVVQVALDHMHFGDSGLVAVGAGVNWDKFVEETCMRGLAGLESMSGIPGRVGATPVQNVGAYGQEVCDTIVEVKALNIASSLTRVFSVAECGFAYRQSRFKSFEKDQWIITEVTFKLSGSSTPNPQYDELQKSLLADALWLRGDRVQKIMAVREHVIKIRSSKGMVLASSDPDTNSLGSFFMNPIVSTAEKSRIFDLASKKAWPRQPTAHSSGDNMWKLSAAWLIENSGVKKGDRIHGARVSTKHVLALTNPSKASTADVLALAAHIKKLVRDTFGIELVQEPVYVD
jgi:UDP-N-acetylmuramate dehydrogenase